MNTDLCQICGRFESKTDGICETCAVELERWRRRFNENGGET